MSTDAPETIVVGLDGAGFDMLDPLFDAGELPTMARIVEDGVSGRLSSVLPPVTSPNWTAYSTGKNPGKLGIFWWQNVDTERERTYLPRERYHAHDELWELLAEETTVGVLGVPTTYPPKPAGEFLVSGPPDAEESGYTHPPALERELERELDYRNAPQYRTGEDPELAYEDWLDLIDLRFRAAKHLLARHDVSFLQVTTFFINQLQHHLWDDERTVRGWKRIDEHLADLQADGRNVVLMSDHGHNRIRTVFRVNEWLQREGYLTWDRSVSDRLHGLGVTTDRLNRLLVRMDRSLPGVTPSDVAGWLAPRWLLAHLPSDEGEVGTRSATNVDWEHTDVLAGGQGPVYLTADPTTDRYDELREELRSRLASLTDPRGRPVARAVHRGEDVYEGPYVEEGPDLVIEKAPGVHIREKFGDAPVFAAQDPIWDGVNRREGLFAAAGPAFGGGTVEDLSILDLMPTLLSVYGLPVPADVDGRVRTDVLAEDVVAGPRPDSE
jgi:predicted AlkP superfamily phosphohydrolase/phosphomutase